MENKNKCPICSKAKKPWFKLCWECTEKEKQVPRCEICDVTVPDGHTLCKDHWKEREESKKQLRSIAYVKTKKEVEFKEKFEGKYYFNSQKFKSKSELIICYFLTTNGLLFYYEPPLDIHGDGKDIRPDFVIEDGKGNTIILEHFGLETPEYSEKRAVKEKAFKKLCNDNSTFYFICTEENDIYNLKERLGKKLNETPLRRVLWK